MSENQNVNVKRPVTAQRKRRGRNTGVPTALVAALLVLAIFFGGLFGFIIANSTNSYREQLETAKARITELENTMTMMGFSEGEDDPAVWTFDDTGDSDEFGDLSGFNAGANSEILWGNTGLGEDMMQYTGESIVVAEFDGGQVTSDEVIEPYNEQVAAQVFGFSDAADVSGDTLASVIKELTAEKIAYKKAEEMGLTKLTAEDEAKLEAAAEGYFAEQANFYAASVDTTGMSEDEAKAAIVAYMKDELGVTVESMTEELKDGYWREKLYNEIVKDVTVTDAEIQAKYDSMLASQKEQFTQYPDDYAFAVMSGQTVAYNLEGYRRVKHVLIAFDSTEATEQAIALTEQIKALNPETDMDKITELQGQLDTLYVSAEAKAEEVLKELEAGADFDALVEKYGMDDGMKYEPAKSRGYYVSASSVDMYDADFVEGAMMLEAAGQVSTPVRSTSGVHIIKYEADVPAGDVQLSELKAQLEGEVLAEKQEQYYADQTAQWLTEANAQYYPERMQ